ncbi:MAG TPA: BlaI/MecI/CopY family transcriptional regulator [Myxococcaceae bacterium]|nr:BlaI/MecI/CopY family transcriptional regulator [Myxococcaceae bacterium]
MSKRVWEPLGTLESSVMEIIWARSEPMTAREVCDRMTGERERAYTTIMTTLDRLHRKGLLVRHRDGVAWRYAPALSRADFEKGLADGLAEEILQVHTEAALAAFVDAAARVDESLLDRLASLIAERRRGRG